MTNRLLLAGVVVLGLAGTTPAETRTWTSANGAHTTEAELLGVDGDAAVLRKSAGGTVRPALSALSPLDRAYARFWVGRRADAGAGLLAARSGFATSLLDRGSIGDAPAPAPPGELFRRVEFGVDHGVNVAYLTPDPDDGKKHPAVLWAHGGFGGIDSWFWESASRQDDQSARAFRDAGIVLMCPSWRGENDNPGAFELFYGEVDDLLAARAYLEGLEYVDPDRIYVAGHSTGGTLTLLAVTATNRFRAAFSFGGAPDMCRVVDGGGYGNTPFDPESTRECRLRSAIHFVDAIRTPTYYFEGRHSSYAGEAERMEALAEQHGAPFTACIIDGGDHFNILAPLTELVAERIVADTGDEPKIAITERLANETFQRENDAHRRRRLAAVADLPVVELSPTAVREVQAILKRQQLDPAETYLRVEGLGSLGFDTRYDSKQEVLIRQDGLQVVVPKDQVDALRGHLIDFGSIGGQSGFKFVDRYEG